MDNTITIISKLQFRRDTAMTWRALNPVLASGEPGYETDTDKCKIGDGSTAWNDLPYREFTLPAAAAETLGGIMADTRETGDTVEAKIDPQTHKLYVPSYPVLPTLAPVATSGKYSDLTEAPDLAAVATSGDYQDLSGAPELAAVATSGDYNDLQNGYALPPASEQALGGIKASPKGIADNVEVKIDPGTHKLFVPSAGGGGAVGTPAMPPLQLRVILRQQTQSNIFYNETQPIITGDLYFRPMCSLEYFNANKDNWSVAFARCNTRRYKPTNAVRKTGWAQKQKSYHIVGDERDLGASSVYPGKTVFNVMDGEVTWTPKMLASKPLSSLIPGAYYGEWVKLPYDLEMIVRRFIYIRQQAQGAAQYTVLPMQNLGPGIKTDTKIKVSGSRNRTNLAVERTSRSDFYASVNLGLCLVHKNDTYRHLVHWNMGPVSEFRALVKRTLDGGTISYHVQFMNCKMKIKR